MIRILILLLLISQLVEPNNIEPKFFAESFHEIMKPPQTHTTEFSHPFQPEFISIFSHSNY